jgi:hypothetical protein
VIFLARQQSLRPAELGPPYLRHVGGPNSASVLTSYPATHLVRLECNPRSSSYIVLHCSLIDIMLSRNRVNYFAGTDQEYLEYLCKVVLEASLAPTASLEECILLLENGLHSLCQPQALRNPLILRRDQSSQNQDKTEESSPVASHSGELAVDGRNSETRCEIPDQTPSIAQPSELIIDTWNPELEYHVSNKDPSDPRTSGHARWLNRTKSFFKEIPTTEEEWIRRRKVACLSSTDAILRVIDCLIAGRLVNGTCRNATTLDGTLDGLQSDLNSLAKAAGSMQSDARFNVNVSNFYSLVFFATCSVALHDGHPQSLVDEALRTFLTLHRGKVCKADAQRLSNLRWGVVWAVQEMERQCRRGLAHRAFELFFLCK